MTFESPYNLFIISTTLILFKAVLFLNTKASQTKAFNQQVKNNIDKFDRDFRFQLNKEEYDIVLRSKKSTSSWGDTRKLPYAFTEQGIYILMTVLKGDLTTKQSIALIDAFKQMKDLHN